MNFFAHKPERIAVDSTISHFLLMFGYKIFSDFFPLFLLERGLNAPKVGYVYLLIYLSMVIASPIVGAFAYKWNPVILSTLGIFGYALYALIMYFSPAGLFFAAQAMLGVAAALFFVSSRIVLIRSRLANYDSAYGLFYSAPIYADLIAPAVGALLIFKFGFSGVFILSFAIHLINMIFSFHTLFHKSDISKEKINIAKIAHSYKTVLSKLKTLGIAPILALSFTILFVEGFFRAFFVLFLKDAGFTQNQVLVYVSIFSILLVPISIFVIRFVSKGYSEKNIIRGSFIQGIGSILIGLFGARLNLGGILGLNLVKSFGGLTVNSGRSGIISRNFPDNSAEAGVLDTVFSPLGVALGSFTGGFIVVAVGYGNLFILGGAIVVAVAGVIKIARLRQKV